MWGIGKLVLIFHINCLFRDEFMAGISENPAGAVEIRIKETMLT
jgi:hypothetical protein